MSETEARISLSIPEGRLEIAGSEAFVDKQMERFGAVIERLLSTPVATSQRNTPAVANGETAGGGESPSPNSGGSSPNSGGSQPSLESFDHVFALADDHIQIITDIPGSSGSEKTCNAALLVLYGNSLRGVNDVPFDTIQEVCRSHGFLDTSNFSKYVKAAKESFVISGSGRRQSARLTVPGRKKAEQLARELNGA